MGLYSRFGGKDGVVDELFAEGFERLTAAMKARPHSDDPLADLRGCAECYRATALANATHYMVMFGGAVPGFEPTEASHLLAHQAFGGLVAQVRRCTDAGLLVDLAPERVAEVLWGSIHGLVMLEIVGINPVGSDPAARFTRALDILFDGLTHG
jgi:AcrR family transcriptional regulator